MMEPAETWEGYPGWVESLVREKLAECREQRMAGPAIEVGYRSRGNE